VEENSPPRTSGHNRPWVLQTIEEGRPYYSRGALHNGKKNVNRKKGTASRATSHYGEIKKAPYRAPGVGPGFKGPQLKGTSRGKNDRHLQTIIAGGPKGFVPR